MREDVQKLLRVYAELPDWLIKPPTSVNSINQYGDHPLDTAAVRGALDEIALLLANGADVRAKGEHNYSALHSAVEQGHIEAVKYLVKFGADMSSINDDGLTALDLADALGEEGIATWLRSQQQRNIE
jgi:uncharacterized protein